MPVPSAPRSLNRTDVRASELSMLKSKVRQVTPHDSTVIIFEYYLTSSIAGRKSPSPEDTVSWVVIVLLVTLNIMIILFITACGVTSIFIVNNN